MWEFPGGKQETDETSEDCLIRECKEELDIAISLEGLLEEYIYSYPDMVIHFSFFNAHILSGIVKSDVHNDVRWIFPKELLDFPFCPADKK